MPLSSVSVVVPTVGRPELARLLAALARAVAVAGAPAEILLVDDRPEPGPTPRVPPRLIGLVRVLRSGGRGPAAARNVGWRGARGRWVAFLDDDVVPPPDWLATLRRDLAVPDGVAGVQGRVVVPLPDGPVTDFARTTARLSDARWATADMAYRRSALVVTGGFDERFRRAYREDAELAYRVSRTVGPLVTGDRHVLHPVRREGRWVSLCAQAGNADDALLRRIHGRRWRRLLGVPRGRRPVHAVTTAAGLVALVAAAVAAAARRPATARAARRSAALAAAVWLALTGQFAAVRIRGGPPGDLPAMLATSVAIPPLAVAHWLRGWWVGRGARPWGAQVCRHR